MVFTQSVFAEVHCEPGRLFQPPLAGAITTAGWGPEPPVVPAGAEMSCQAGSLCPPGACPLAMFKEIGNRQQGVAVGVGEALRVTVGVAVGARVEVMVAVDVVLGVGLGDLVAVRVSVAVRLTVADGDRDGVRVGVAVAGVAVIVGTGVHFPSGALTIDWMSACESAASKISSSLITISPWNGTVVGTNLVPPIQKGTVLPLF